jgi:hypothetical protein
MRRDTEACTVSSPLRGIAVIPWIIKAHLGLIRTLEASKPATHLILDTNTKRITCGTTAWRVRVSNTSVTFLALESVRPTPTTDLVGIRR